MNHNFFANCTTVEEIKATYRRLAREHHPDLGGDPEIMKALNNAYEKALKGCHGQESVGTDGKTHTYKYDEAIERDVMEAVFALLALDMKGVDITLIGLWVWVVGDTKPYKEQLKELKCRWNNNRSCWYYRPEALGYRRSSGGSFSELAEKYGVTDCSKFKTRNKTAKAKALHA